MLYNPYDNNISIDNYKQEIFMTFMLALHLYVTHSLNFVYVEVIANIQCYLSTRETQFNKKKERQGILPTNMLEYLEVHNSIVSDVHM